MDTLFPKQQQQIVKPVLSLCLVQYLTDFAPASRPPRTLAETAKVRFLASVKCDPLGMSLDPEGVGERDRNCSWVRGYI